MPFAYENLVPYHFEKLLSFPKERLDKTDLIEAFFEKAKKNKPSLFNGPCLLGYFQSQDTLSVFNDSYASYLTQHSCPELFEQKYYILSVTGILLSQEQVLVAKRSQNVLQNKDQWDLLPSGAIESFDFSKNTPDFEKQLHVELEEETGISSHDIQGVDFLTTYIDKENYVIDFCFCLKISNKPQIILNKEFSNYSWENPNKPSHQLASSAKAILTAL